MKINFVITLTFVTFLGGCAVSGKTLSEKQTSQDVWVKYYTREASEWREDGIEPMAEYFDNRAREEREKNIKTDSGLLGFLFN